MHLTSSELIARSGAIRFFQMERAAADDGGLLAALNSDGGLFTDVQDPIPGSAGDLRKELARALTNHPLRLRDPATLDAVRGEALRPGMAGGVVAGLFDTDKEWPLQNARRIVELTPTAYTNLLLNLALRREQLVSFVENLRGVVPDDVAKAIARDRFDSRPELLEECLRALERAAAEPH